MLTQPVQAVPVARSPLGGACTVPGGDLSFYLYPYPSECADQSFIMFTGLPAEGADTSWVIWSPGNPAEGVDQSFVAPWMMPSEGADQSLWLGAWPSEGADA